ADNTIFQFLDLTYCKPVFLDWIKPNKREKLADYALRMKAEYQLPDNAIIVGQSFGGVLTIEIARAFPQVKAIVLSSVKSFSELPPFYSKGKYFSIHSLVPPFLQRKYMLNLREKFGLHTPEYIKIYERIVSNTDFYFNNWAVSALLRWENKIAPLNVIHIHGSDDKMFPIKYVKSDFTVQGGGHLMVMEHAPVVSEHLKTLISGG
uniref:alpha/beta fold hydrolase n=1 Tax=Dyadobacter sp. OTU695 TaxID=3043860 RepID=UPI00313C3563